MPELSQTVAAIVGADLIETARARRRPATPAELGKRLRPDWRITPAQSLMSDVIAAAVLEPNRRVVISAPPREGKTTMAAVFGVLFSLMINPDSQNVLVSYSDQLAQDSSRDIRALVTEHAQLLGFSIAADKTAVGRWKIEGRRGGLLAVGIGSSILGFGCDGLMVIDDPIKNAQEADSVTFRRNVKREYEHTLLTRMQHGGSLCLISSRWHPDDLAGSLLREDPQRWDAVNIPAISAAGIPDALGREPDVPMTSTVGRDRGHFDDLRRGVGDRAWVAMFQGCPVSPEGGLILAAWIDSHRLPSEPPRPVRTHRRHRPVRVRHRGSLRHHRGHLGP